MQIVLFFTLRFSFLDVLIRSNCHYFVRKFVVCVFMDAYIGIWVMFAFLSQTALRAPGRGTLLSLYLRWRLHRVCFEQKFRPYDHQTDSTTNIVRILKLCRASLHFISHSSFGGFRSEWNFLDFVYYMPQGNYLNYHLANSLSDCALKIAFCCDLRWKAYSYNSSLKLRVENK